ncbi:hypothetical protein BH10BAC1_BH10BAC1_01060 [soil metagenome]
MKKLSIVICILFSLQFIVGQVTPPVKPTGAQMKFVVEVIDYGTIQQGSNGKREFKFTNTGKELLVINMVKSSCGCLIPGWPKDPIKPGASGIITGEYDTNRIGRFEKTLTVISNDESRPTIVLKIKGNVLPLPVIDSTAIPK